MKVQFICLIIFIMLLAITLKRIKRIESKCILNYANGDQKELTLNSFINSKTEILDKIERITCKNIENEGSVLFPAINGVKNLFISIDNLSILDLSQLNEVKLITIDVDNSSENINLKVKFPSNSLIEQINYLRNGFQIIKHSISREPNSNANTNEIIFKIDNKSVNLFNYGNIKSLNVNSNDMLNLLNVTQSDFLDEIKIVNNKKLDSIILNVENINTLIFEKNKKIKTVELYPNINSIIEKLSNVIYLIGVKKITKAEIDNQELLEKIKSSLARRKH